MKQFSKILFFFVFAFGFNRANACDISYATLISQIDNGNCTYTYVIKVCREYLGLEGDPDSLTFAFDCGVTVNAGFSPTTYQTSSGDIYTGTATGSFLNYGTNSVFTSHNADTLVTIFTITTTGHANTVVINTHPGYPSAACSHTLNLPAIPGPAVSPLTICSGNTATLTAGCQGSNAKWYDMPSGGTLLFTGMSYTTPVLTGNQTYYVECACPSGCASARSSVLVTVNNCNGIVDENGNQLSVFPNPTTEIIYVQMTNDNENAKVEVLNMQGQQLLKLNIPLKANQAYPIQISQLPKGIYVIKVGNAETKFIKD